MMPAGCVNPTPQNQGQRSVKAPATSRDLADQPATTPGVAVNRTLRLTEELTDDLDEKERMCSAATELETASSDDNSEGTDIAAVEVLQDLLLGDSQVKAAPLKVQMKPEVAQVKWGLRGYPPTYVAFLDSHALELEEAGLVIVPKKDPGDLRMTIDSRPINACIEGDKLVLLLKVLNICRSYGLKDDTSEFVRLQTAMPATAAETAAALTESCLFDVVTTWVSI
ncbi:hypothetical protein H310_06257 [Aphanomyces invadans]|uniref:Uncharacterized protein n=1 Tax=Aphanomyces invadans TaxID=157072 RepID=A0A024U5X3_9STRA|nr:hypothetical protein H310_06257 [Aphanomyces invadans]ETW01625.1 hypothetical protein H310_06257 [Aphanomyces invadans]|eukprot:XP_008869473.1 hypothetical protein H310_06257 [Aphanomyces invadans]